MRKLCPLAPWLRAALFTGLTVGCLPSQFDDVTSHREDDDPSTACDAGSDNCPAPEADAGSTPSDASAPKDAGTPPTDAGAPVDSGAPDAGPRDAGPPPPVDAGLHLAPRELWPTPTVAALDPRKGCVYAQWCKEFPPSASTAVCRLYPSSECVVSASAREECIEDLAASDCGRVKPPILLCDRASSFCVTL